MLRQITLGYQPKIILKSLWTYVMILYPGCSPWLSGDTTEVHVCSRLIYPCLFLDDGQTNLQLGKVLYKHIMVEIWHSDRDAVQMYNAWMHHWSQCIVWQITVSKDELCHVVLACTAAWWYWRCLDLLTNAPWVHLCNKSLAATLA